MRAKIMNGGIEVELVGSPSELATVLRDLMGQAQVGELPPTASFGPTTTGSLEAEEAEADGGATNSDEAEIIGALAFFSERKPTNNREATAVAAYYLAEKAPSRDRTETLTKDSLGDIFRQAQWKLPKRLDQTLVDTTSAGYLNRVDTGVYELSNTGHNLVVHTLGNE